MAFFRNGMKIYRIPAERLTPEQVAAWAEIQQAAPSFDSPYFRPEFTQAVAAVREGVEVAVMEDGGVPVGFFPFQRWRGNVVMAVGGRMSDFHGVIAKRDATWEPAELLRACGVSAWHFDHLIASQQPLVPYHWRVAPSPYIDLSQGWEAYRAQQRAKHGEYFRRAERKWRHAQREAGPIRLELHTTDQRVFRDLLRWKTEQYRRTQVTSVLDFGWTVSLLEHIRQTEGPRFSGVMSTLYMGGILAAVLFSMRSGCVLHAWFSAYRPEFSSLSPGIVLWLELFQALPAAGIQRVDLGKGPEEYKKHLMSGAIEVAEGSLDLRPLAGRVRRSCRQAYDWVRTSSLRKPLLVPGRMLRRMVEARTFR